MEGSNRRWRRAVSGGGERSLVEGSDRRWLGAVSLSPLPPPPIPLFVPSSLSPFCSLSFSSSLLSAPHVLFDMVSFELKHDGSAGQGARRRPTIATVKSGSGLAAMCASASTHPGVTPAATEKTRRQYRAAAPRIRVASPSD